MRVEHQGRQLRPVEDRGSSPHARGTLAGKARGDESLRIIPACAGNTMCIRRLTWCARDHPRMRGEHLPVPLCAPWIVGSSPHARGTPLMMPMA